VDYASELVSCGSPPFVGTEVGGEGKGEDHEKATPQAEGRRSKFPTSWERQDVRDRDREAMGVWGRARTRPRPGHPGF